MNPELWCMISDGEERWLMAQTEAEAAWMAEHIADGEPFGLALWEDTALGDLTDDLAFVIDQLTREGIHIINLED